MPASLNLQHEQAITTAHFNQTADYWFEVYQRAETFAGYNLLCAHQFILETAQTLPPNGRILDMGCGAGVTALALAQEGYTVSGVDIAESMVNRAHQEAEKQHLTVDFRVAVADQLPYGEAEFDLVYGLGLIGNLVDDRPALAEMFRVLKPNGLLVLTVPNVCGLDRWLALPKSLPLIAGPVLRKKWFALKNKLRAWRGKTPLPENRLRYGRSVIPWRYGRTLEKAGFRRVSYQALTFGPFYPLGFQFIPDTTSIEWSEGLKRAKIPHFLGNQVIYWGQK